MTAEDGKSVAYLAYRPCALTAPTNRDGRPVDSTREQGRRLGLLLSSNRADFTASDTLSMTVARLEDLARFTADRTQRESRSDLVEQVSLYRNDIEYLKSHGTKHRVDPPRRRRLTNDHRS